MDFDLTLYLVTDSTDLTDDLFLEKIEQACQSGVTLVQLREKEQSTRDYLHLATKVKHITDTYHIPLIINDRLDIALAIDAAGIHVGQSDLPVAIARKLLGPDKIIGATTKTLEQAKEAVMEGANYLGVGAIYPTTTKVKTVLTDVRVLKTICDTIPVPVVAIGGLNEENCHILKGSGISGIAVVSALMKASSINEATASLKQTVLTLKA